MSTKITFFNNKYIFNELIYNDKNMYLYKVKKSNEVFDSFYLVKQIIINEKRLLVKYEDKIKDMQRMKNSTNFISIEDYEIISDKNNICINILFEESLCLVKYLFEKDITNKELLMLFSNVISAVYDAEKVGIDKFYIDFDNVFVNRFGNYKIDLTNHNENVSNDLRCELGIFLYKLFNNGRYDGEYSIKGFAEILSHCNLDSNIVDIINKVILKNSDLLEIKHDVDRLRRNILSEKVVFSNEEYIDNFYKTVNFSDCDLSLYDSKTKKKIESFEKTHVISDIKDSQNTLKVDLDKTVIIKKDNRIVDNKIDNEVIDLNKTTIIKNNKVNKENIEDFNKTTIIEDRNVLNNSSDAGFNISNNNSKKGKFFIIFGIALLVIILIVVIVFVFKNNNLIEVDNLVGKSGSAAVLEIKNNELNYKIKYKVTDQDLVGKVLHQSNIGKKIDKDSNVTITVGISSEKVAVPDVCGLNRDAAVRKLEDVGLSAIINYGTGDSDLKDKVVEQMVDSGSIINRGMLVEIIVGK